MVSFPTASWPPRFLAGAGDTGDRSKAPSSGSRKSVPRGLAEKTGGAQGKNVAALSLVLQRGQKFWAFAVVYFRALENLVWVREQGIRNGMTPRETESQLVVS